MMRTLQVTSLVVLLALVAAPLEARTNVEFWVTWGPDSAIGASFVKMAQQFNESQAEVTVDVRAGVANYEEKVVVAHAGGAAPDAFALDNLPTFVPLLEPLDNYVAQDRIPLDDFIPALLEGGQMNGKLYGLPYMAAFMGFTYYNLEHFGDAGIAQAPATWDDLGEYGRKLVKMEGERVVRTGMEIPPGGGGVFQTFLSLALQNGAELLDSARTDLTWDSDQAIAAWDFLVGLGQRQVVDPRRLSWGNNFVKEQTSIYYGPSGGMGNIESAAKFQWAISPPIAGVRPATIGSGWLYGISSDSKAKEAAWKWVRFMVSPEAMLERGVLSGQLPGRLSAIRRSPWAKDARYRELARSTEVLFGDANPLLRNTAAFDELVPRLLSALRGERSARDAILEAARLVRSRVGIR